ncbi:MAG: hypothetical protein AAF530_12240 [Pseudomonadota bacterium]
MPRPCLKDQRWSQVLNALQIRIARYGAEEATPERITEESGLARVMVRWTRGFVDEIAGVVRKSQPRADEDAVQAVDAGPAALFCIVESMAPLGLITGLPQATRGAALRLAGTLAG